ncbi:hypothetical protein CANARDRAFT_6955 [[Candida] arabinofermentans NRRL YB-2248]|uniref:DH domain-containing protein n=1 Tax=[Candida] arabinofermentans NRRL YB-2248 TaxID=983967 RepID=A0A1E4T405_9ASCO|nr:hypothetical protein CANARDRAFT_6955 [[Candida] arabinofermentans NRRL YB-2248]
MNKEYTKVMALSNTHIGEEFNFIDDQSSFSENESNQDTKVQSIAEKGDKSGEEEDSQYFDTSSSTSKSNNPSSGSICKDGFKEDITLETAGLLTPPGLPTPSPAVQRSYKRQKQIKELLDSEKNYLESLEDLRDVYLENLIKSEDVPIFINVFKDCVDRLHSDHVGFFKGLLKLYKKWLTNIENTNNLSSSIYSPVYDLTKPHVSDMANLEAFIDWINQECVKNEKDYCLFCELQPKVLEYVKDKNIERFRKQNVFISFKNYYTIDSTNSEPKMKSNGPDMGFLSLVQKPTRRVMMYEISIKSLQSKSIKDVDPQLAEKLQGCVALVVAKCNFINDYLAKVETSNRRASQLNLLMGPFMQNHFDRYYLCNLGSLTFAGGFAAIWLQESFIKADYVGAFLFNHHLMLVKFHKLTPVDVYVIPLVSIFNIQMDDFGEQGVIFTTYPFCFKLQFEECNSHYEVCVILSSDEEKREWLNILNSTIAICRKGISYDFEYSDLKENVNATSSLGCEKSQAFNFNCSLPDNIKPFRNRGQDYFSMKDLVSFTVNHFIGEKNSHCSREIHRARARLSSSYDTQIPVIEIKKHSRESVERALGDLWSKDQLPTYMSDLTKRLSDFNLRKKLSMTSISSFNGDRDNTNGLSRQSTTTRQKSSVVHSKSFSQFDSNHFTLNPAPSRSTRGSMLSAMNRFGDSTRSIGPYSLSLNDNKDIENASIISKVSKNSTSNHSLSASKSHFNLRRMFKSFTVRSGLSQFKEKPT